jgi:hypothetical protein
MSKNMFAALEDEEEIQQPVAVAAEPPKPVKVFTLEDMVNEQNEVERKMALGMSWYDIFMREDEEKRWREEAKFGKSDDWTDINYKKIQQKPSKSRRRK